MPPPSISKAVMLGISRGLSSTRSSSRPVLAETLLSELALGFFHSQIIESGSFRILFVTIRTLRSSLQWPMSSGSSVSWLNERKSLSSCWKCLNSFGSDTRQLWLRFRSSRSLASVMLLGMDWSWLYDRSSLLRRLGVDVIPKSAGTYVSQLWASPITSSLLKVDLLKIPELISQMLLKSRMSCRSFGHFPMSWSKSEILLWGSARTSRKSHSPMEGGILFRWHLMISMVCTLGIWTTVLIMVSVRSVLLAYLTLVPSLFLEGNPIGPVARSCLLNQLTDLFLFFFFFSSIVAALLARPP
mmetsp:Transcript_128501/g.363685  ORF Transcript_128501/g.363685 Transcript_128501/m.363685 type:complete len:300 (+) Transcript_128501:1874-2773(+)